MEPQTGLEPATSGLEVRCSVHLSYWGIWCGRRGSNPYGLLHRGLSPARLPVSPRPHIGARLPMEKRVIPLLPFGEAALLESRRLACVRIIGLTRCAGTVEMGHHPWCRRWESNPHALRRQILNLVRLPISPHRHIAACLGKHPLVVRHV